MPNENELYLSALESHMDREGLSQRELARHLKVSQTTISKWLLRKNDIARRFYPRIREKCGPVPATVAQELLEDASIAADSTIPNTPDLQGFLMNLMIGHGQYPEDLAEIAGHNSAGTIKKLLFGIYKNWFPPMLSAILLRFDVLEDAPLTEHDRLLIQKHMSEPRAMLPVDMALFSMEEAAELALDESGQFLNIPPVDQAAKRVTVPTRGRQHLAAFRVADDEYRDMPGGSVIFCDMEHEPHADGDYIVGKYRDQVIFRAFRLFENQCFLSFPGHDDILCKISDFAWYYPVDDIMLRYQKPNRKRRVFPASNRVDSV